MLMQNGGRIGAQNTPSQVVASGIWSPDEASQAKLLSQWPLANDGLSDPHFANVVLLAHLSDSGFVDQKGHSVTVSGSPTRVAGPAGFGQCISFASSADFLTYDNASHDIDMGTGPFTVEVRLSIAASQPGFSRLLNMAADSGYVSGGGLLGLAGPDSGFVWNTMYNGWKAYGDTPPYSPNTWTSLMCQRDGSNNFVMGINGVFQAATSTETTNYASDIIVLNGGTTGAYWQGVQMKAAELRITKGVARYTGSYSPATQTFPDS